MTRAWPPIVLLALVFTGAWVVGHYSGDNRERGAVRFPTSNVIVVRATPTANGVTGQTMRITSEQLQRALRGRRPPVTVTVKLP